MPTSVYAQEQGMNPFHTKAYAEDYFARRGTYPCDYDPNAPEPEPEPEPTVAKAVEEAVRRSNHQRDLRQDCPGYMINKKVANCSEIHNDTELKCIGLLNFLMRKHGYTYMTNEQLALWLRMKNSESARHLLARLCKRGLIENTGSRNGQIRWVVREDLRDPKKKR